MQKIMKSTKLNSKVCFRIWELINPENEDFFSKPQFLMTMFLCTRAKDGVPLPSQIPEELK